MKKFLKITGIVLLVIIILMVVLPFAFKGKIIELVKKEVSKSLTADVDFKKIGLSLFSDFPYLSVNIHEVSVVGRETFTGDTLAYVEKLHLAVNVKSLFGDDGIEVRKINIHHPIANLLIDKDGNANWDIVKPSETPTEEPIAEDTAQSSFRLKVKDLAISKGHIVYDDQQGKMKAIADNLNFRLSGDLTLDLAMLKAALSIEKATFVMDGIPYLSNAKVDFNGDIEADLVNYKYTLQENVLGINALELDFAGWVAMPGDDIDMDLSAKVLKSDFKNFLSLIPALYAKDFADIQTKGTLGLTASIKGTLTETSYPAFDVNLLIENAMFKYPDLPKSVDNIQLAAHVFSPGGDLDNMVVDVPKLHLEMGSNPFDLKLLLKKIISNPTFDFLAQGTINLNMIRDFYPLDETMDVAGVITADLKAQGDMNAIDAERYEDINIAGVLSLADGKLKTDMVKDPVDIKQLKMDFSQRYVNLLADAKIGKNDIAAEGRLENFIGYALRNDLIKGNLKLNSNYLNLNDLLGLDPNAPAEEMPPADGNAPAPAEEAMSVIEIPNNIDFALNLDVKQLIYDNFDLRQVLGTVAIKDQILDLKNLSMKALDGDMKVAGKYIAKNPANPEIDMNVGIHNVDIQQTANTFMTIKTMLPIIENANGRFSVDLNIKTLLDKTMSPDFNTLNGEGKISSPGVKIEGVEVLNKVADVVKMDKLRKISLKAFAFTFKCVNGRVITSPFDLNFDNSKATISGSSGLDETIDYVAKMQIPRTEFGSTANDFLNQISGNILGTGINVKLPDIIKFDLTVKGTFTDPKIGVSGLDDMGKDVVNQIVDQGKEKINEQIDKALEEAKKQRDKLIAEAQKQKDNLVQQARSAGDKLLAEADKQGQELIKKAGNNPIAKKAAEEGVKKLKSEAQKKMDDLVKEAEKQGDNLINTAKKKGDDLINEAEKKKL